MAARRAGQPKPPTTPRAVAAGTPPAARRLGATSPRSSPPGPPTARRPAYWEGPRSLEHQRHPLPASRLPQPTHQKRRCHVVGQVRHDLARRRTQRRQIECERIRLVQHQPSVGRRRQLRQRGQRPAIKLDRVHARRQRREQRAGQSARSGAHFNHVPAIERSGKRGDARQQRRVEQKMLAERLARIEPEARNDLPKRREFAETRQLDRISITARRCRSRFS